MTRHLCTLWRPLHPSTYDARMTISPLIDAETLVGRKGRFVALDASVLLPGQSGDMDAAFREAHLPGARRFDIDVFADPESTLPHTVPGAARFGRLMGELGLCPEDTLVFYDQRGSVGACRGWWLARLFGHSNAFVLDGGLQEWREAGGPVEAGVVHAVPALYRPRPNYRLLAGSGDVASALNSAEAVVFDARSAARFAGDAPEPRSGVRSGHMPGALNMEWGRLIDARGRFLPRSRIQDLLAAADGRSLIATCGSGLTAATILVAAAIAGYGEGALYDGSWAEWGSDPDATIIGKTAT